MNLDITQGLRNELEVALQNVAGAIGRIQIGSNAQFPFGWRKAAKGRTVWRILEEAITQNLEHRHKDFGFLEIYPADSEVGVYDFRGRLSSFEKEDFYVNIKSAVIGARTNKDDISKAESLATFYAENPDKNLFVATFIISFEDDMSVHIMGAKVMPTAWLPDIYVNPSNNGNLQSSKYKDIDHAVIRTNQEFLEELQKEITTAKAKKAEKAKRA